MQFSRLQSCGPPSRRIVNRGPRGRRDGSLAPWSAADSCIWTEAAKGFAPVGFACRVLLPAVLDVSRWECSCGWTHLLSTGAQTTLPRWFRGAYAAWIEVAELRADHWLCVLGDQQARSTEPGRSAVRRVGGDAGRECPGDASWFPRAERTHGRVRPTPARCAEKDWPLRIAVGPGTSFSAEIPSMRHAEERPAGLCGSADPATRGGTINPVAPTTFRGWRLPGGRLRRRAGQRSGGCKPATTPSSGWCV